METAEQEDENHAKPKRKQRGGLGETTTSSWKSTKTKEREAKGTTKPGAAVAEPGNEQWGQAERTPVREKELASPSPDSRVWGQRCFNRKLFLWFPSCLWSCAYAHSFGRLWEKQQLISPKLLEFLKIRKENTLQSFHSFSPFPKYVFLAKGYYSTVWFLFLLSPTWLPRVYTSK